MSGVEQTRPQAETKLRRAQMLIDGARVDSMSGELLTVENPAKRQPIAEIPRGDAADVNGAVEAAARAYVWTHDIGVGLRAAHAIESGWVQVNQGLGQQPGHSYGGYKQSGIGREFSLEGMLDSFTQRKNVTINLNTPRRQ
jgi:acyl-CoA reductase-like NAD-dependent aldehyde dehydrogenase